MFLHVLNEGQDIDDKDICWLWILNSLHLVYHTVKYKESKFGRELLDFNITSLYQYKMINPHFQTRNQTLRIRIQEHYYQYYHTNFKMGFKIYS